MHGDTIRPPQLQGIGDEIARVARGTEHDVKLMGRDFQNAGRREHGVGMHVVIDGPHRFRTAGHAAAREFADLYFGLGIERDPERFRLTGGLSVNVPQVVEDGVGLGNFF